MNILRLLKNRYRQILVTLILVSTVLFGFWWQFISLKPYKISQTELQNIYQQHDEYTPELVFTKISTGRYKITFRSYDEEAVEGRLELPVGKTLQQWELFSQNEPSSVFLGVSAMGKNYLRWWQDSFKDRPTITQVDKIGAMALASNQVLVAIDARYHGTRKTEDLPLSKIMNSLHLWGERSYYEQMVMDTVLDYKHLVNAIEARFGRTNITVAGYSMGAQVSLILAATDNRVKNVLAIVPPNVDNKVAKVAPINFVGNIDAQKIWLLSANGDEYAGEEQNLRLFSGIKSTNKHHITFDSDHILPETYTESLSTWFE
jgi:S-formylglutathione hydrolase FrmB